MSALLRKLKANNRKERRRQETNRERRSLSCFYESPKQPKGLRETCSPDGTAHTVSTFSVTTPASDPSDPIEESQQMDVSSQSQQVQSVGATPQPSAQQQPNSSDSPSLEASQAQSAQHSTGVRQQSPALAPADEMQDQQRLRQEKLEIYSQLMMDSMYEAQPRLAPGHEAINKAVYKAAEFMSQYQYDQLEEARSSILQFAEKCLKGHVTYYTDRPTMGHDDATEMVEAIVLADEMMPELLPAAFNVCVEQQERYALAQSIDQELRRVEREKELQREAEAQQPAAPQAVKCNAEDVTRLIVDRMAELFYNKPDRRNLSLMN